MTEQTKNITMDKVYEMAEFCEEHPAKLSADEFDEVRPIFIMVAKYAARKGFTDVDTTFAELVPELRSKTRDHFFMEEIPALYDYLRAEAWREDSELKQQVEFIRKVAWKAFEDELKAYSHRFSYDFKPGDILKDVEIEEVFFSEIRLDEHLAFIHAFEVAFEQFYNEKFLRTGLNESAFDVINTLYEGLDQNHKELIVFRTALKSAGLTVKDLQEIGTLQSDDWVKFPFLALYLFTVFGLSAAIKVLDRAAKEGRHPAIELYFQLGAFTRQHDEHPASDDTLFTVYEETDRVISTRHGRDEFFAVPAIQRAIEASDLKPEDARDLPLSILAALL